MLHLSIFNTDTHRDRIELLLRMIYIQKSRFADIASLHMCIFLFMIEKSSKTRLVGTDMNFMAVLDVTMR